MSEGLQWLVEDRDRWKRRAEAAEAELDRRCAVSTAEARDVKAHPVEADLSALEFMHDPRVATARGLVASAIGKELLDRGSLWFRRTSILRLNVGVWCVPPPNESRLSPELHEVAKALNLRKEQPPVTSAEAGGWRWSP